ncbi:MAG TPA: SH3 domain-containing C40 family peptidase [Longimicrobiales bacterium]|nr:SH3 domain-containing C40 family peptidase [Longimicrobiales bacterium]
MGILDDVRRRHVPDARWEAFDVALDVSGDEPALTGETTVSDAVADALARLADAGIRARDEVVRLPHRVAGADGDHALVRTALAPVYGAPVLPAPQISQLVLGMRVEVLSSRGPWLRIRGEDGYLGWVQAGYLERGSAEWAMQWERGTGGEPVVSLGADLVDEDGSILARLPWGARIARHSGAYHLPDGGSGIIAHGEVVDVDRLSDRFPARGESIVRTARRWMGAPYLWGGVSFHGVDCSGLTQAVMWMHGIALPRDSDLQAATRVGVEVAADLDALRAGDLLFFAETGDRITHVAISTGGPRIIHSAITNGAVQVNDLAGSAPLEQRLAATFVRARRLLAD